MMPRTTYLPSDLTDTQALSLGRTITSNGVPAGRLAAELSVGVFCAAAAEGGATTGAADDVGCVAAGLVGKVWTCCEEEAWSGADPPVPATGAAAVVGCWDASGFAGIAACFARSF